MYFPVSVPREPNAQRPPALFSEDPFGFVERRRLDVRKPTFCEVPEAVAAASSGDRDLAPAFEELEHHADVSTPVPAARLPGSDGAVDELAGQQRTAALEL